MSNENNNNLIESMKGDSDPSVADPNTLQYPHVTRKISVFLNINKQDVRLPLQAASATDGKKIAAARGISRVLLFTEYIERGLAEDRKLYLSLQQCESTVADNSTQDTNEIESQNNPDTEEPSL